MIYLKSCPRCQGDVELDSDVWGAYMKCLQCGQTWHPRNSRERSDIMTELKEQVEVAVPLPETGEAEEPVEIRPAV